MSGVHCTSLKASEVGPWNVACNEKCVKIVLCTVTIIISHKLPQNHAWLEFVKLGCPTCTTTFRHAHPLKPCPVKLHHQLNWRRHPLLHNIFLLCISLNCIKHMRQLNPRKQEDLLKKAGITRFVEFHRGKCVHHLISESTRQIHISMVWPRQKKMMFAVSVSPFSLSLSETQQWMRLTTQKKSRKTTWQWHGMPHHGSHCMLC